MDVLVLGGGAGGLNVTSVAAQLGLKTVLIEEKSQLGGDCLHTGCVPSKSLIHLAKTAWLLQQAHSSGMIQISPSVDFAKVQALVQQNIAHIQRHDSIERFESYGAKVVLGKGIFADKHTVVVNDSAYHAKKIFIATGSYPFIPPIVGLDKINYLTNESIFELTKLPRRLLVMGGGAIGIELAQAFRRLGSQVIIVESAQAILTAFDDEISATLHSQLTAEGIVIYTNATIQKVEQTVTALQAVIQCAQQDTLTVEFDHLLLATGRAPQVQQLCLEAALIKYSNQGVEVNRRLQTTQRHIYAIGDVVNRPYKFTHMAEYHAGIAIQNALFKIPKKLNDRAVPSVIFSDPECAMVGLTHKQASWQNIAYESLRFSFADVDRAIVQQETKGYVELRVQKNKLLGASIVGPSASELIAYLALAIEANIPVNIISRNIIAYPTLSQIHKRAVNTRYAPMLFDWKTKCLVKFLNLFS